MAADPIVPGMPASVIRLYCSLIFIILSFVLGAFAGRGLPTAGQDTAVKAAAVQPPARALGRLAGEMEVGDLFVEGTAGLNESTAAAYAQVLKSHDIALHATVYPDVHGAPTTDDAALELAIRRGLALKYYLVSEGVPRSAVQIYSATAAAHDDGRSVQARVSFVVEENSR